MRRNILDIADFHDRLGRGEEVRSAVRLAPNAEIKAAEGRTVTFVFSDASVDRYGDTIDQRGWVLDKYRSNPVVLFGHNDKSVANVIGKALNVRIEGGALMGDIEFAPAAANPDAEIVYQLVKGGYLNSVSVGFQPIEWALSKDKSRAGGVDFKKQELLEISVVPVPANANALVQAKAAGIDFSRLKLAEPKAERSLPTIKEKGLYEVSWLACLLADLSWLEEMVEWEADYEGDGSPVPMMITDAVNQLGQALVAMTVEEVTELLAEETEEKRFAGLMKHAANARKAGEVEGLFTPNQIRALQPPALPTFGAPLIERAGKTISSVTEKELRDAHALISEGCNKIMKLVDVPAEEPGETDEPSEEQTKAKALAEAIRIRVA